MGAITGQSSESADDYVSHSYKTIGVMEYCSALVLQRISPSQASEGPSVRLTMKTFPVNDETSALKAKRRRRNGFHYMYTPFTYAYTP